MFSFHKPKIYRSNLGCCICKAKSSSSRFTDSKKYENEFERCFRIEEKRSGEICNACVLLVKRWKKLSAENRLIKHWHHVVDARAGPGTKLTSNRRLTGPSYNQLARSHSPQDRSTGASGSSSSSSASSSSSLTQQQQHQKQQQQKQQRQRLNNSSASNSGSSSVLPLSSSQTTNQAMGSPSGAGSSCKPRAGSFSKARAIDTNVSTFTFGEPNYRPRSYMSAETSSPSTSYFYSGSYSALAKPQSALNSSAFESVIKRFRQRQQQQKLQAQRRQQRLQQQLLYPPSTKRILPSQKLELHNDQCSQKQQPLADTIGHHQLAKRVKRSSESTGGNAPIGTLAIDGHRVSSLLDQNVWRKEKICCGTIFRGLHNEVAVFPKLLKPCRCRTKAKLREAEEEELEDGSGRELIDQVQSVTDAQQILASADSPPPRTEKSGSISSCDSNTSGVGSMAEQSSPTDNDQRHLQWASDDNESSQWNTHQFFITIGSTK